MKIDDLVVCVSDVSAIELNEGERYIVTEVTGDGGFIKVKGIAGLEYTELYCSWRFKLLE
ncbi:MULTISPECIES: hypothetical protein [unclassified Serratia (in: enterobacteria)]|uniref:hypothetical protein n=1 Tax=unclassified Serratia (in: enterobacteria) TaxID=2647522 RepID=UPI00046ABA91|nr:MULTISPECIES: hypothetical protein [unclassified Serratia (in: enterobacteria)]